MLVVSSNWIALQTLFDTSWRLVYIVGDLFNGLTKMVWQSNNWKIKYFHGETSSLTLPEILWQSNNLCFLVKDLFPSFAKTPWNSNFLLQLLKLLFWKCFAWRPEQKMKTQLFANFSANFILPTYSQAELSLVQCQHLWGTFGPPQSPANPSNPQSFWIWCETYILDVKQVDSL